MPPSATTNCSMRMCSQSFRPVRVSFGLLDETGTLRSGTIDVPEVTGGPRRASAAIAVAPGWHRLTLVAEDGQGRLGSLTRAVQARLREVGDFTLAEPRVLWRADTDTWQMLGGDTLPDDARVAAAVFELYPGAADRERDAGDKRPALGPRRARDNPPS